MQRKKVLIAIPDMHFGGSERATAEIANYLSKSAVDTSVLLMYDRKITYNLAKNVKVILPKKNFNKILNLFYLIYFIRSEIKSNRPDTVLAMGYKTFTIIACIGLRVRLVDSLRTSANRIRYPNNKLLNWTYIVVRKLIRWRVDGVIAQTDRARIELKKKYSCKIIVIPNSVRRIKQYQIKRRNIVLSVGRLSVEKGHIFLMNAFAKLKTDGWTLKFVGSGPQKKALEKKAKKLGISELVKFEGFQTNVDYFMQEAKIFVLPSLIEGFPNALLEAMANGLPCISFNCDSGPAEIIEHGVNGYITETKNTKELACYLRQLIEDKSLREKIGENAKKVKEKYDINLIGERYLNFLFYHK